MAKVFCPKCGNQMTRGSDGLLACPEVGNWLSPRMQALLPELATESPVASATTGRSVNWGGRWHCPADGLTMQQEPGGVYCSDCGRRLIGSVIYELTEFNPHIRTGQPGDA